MLFFDYSDKINSIASSVVYGDSSAIGSFASKIFSYSSTLSAFISINGISDSGTSLSAYIALTGHAGSHNPQSIHSSGSMTSMLGPS